MPVEPLTAQSTRTGLLCAEFQHFLSCQLVGSSDSTAPASPAGYLVNVRYLSGGVQYLRY